MKSIKFIAIFTILLTTIFTFNTQTFAQSQTEILIVGDQKLPCTGVGKMECLQVKRINETDYSLFYQNIEKFNYVAGYYYVLEVKTTNVKNPPADGSSVKYTLKKVLARVKTETNNSPNFFGTEWRLKKIEGEAINIETPFIKFDEGKNSLGGNGGCNVFGGSMEKNGKNLKFSQVFSTKMYCEGTQKIEDQYLSKLEKIDSYEIKNNKLFLKSNDKVLLEFEAKK